MVAIYLTTDAKIEEHRNHYLNLNMQQTYRRQKKKSLLQANNWRMTEKKNR